MPLSKKSSLPALALLGLCASPLLSLLNAEEPAPIAPILPISPPPPPAEPLSPSESATDSAPTSATTGTSVLTSEEIKVRAPKEGNFSHGSSEFTIGEADNKLFEKKVDIGRVGDKPTGSLRRLVQRTIMPTELKAWHGAVLTFDDQIIPASPDHASAMEIVKDLQPLGVRSIFFANIPGVDKYTVEKIAKRKGSFEDKEKACLELLQGKKAEFIKASRELLRLKNPADPKGHIQYSCEIYNHTAFHQDLLYAKADSHAFRLGMTGIRFIEECLDEAYSAERPDWSRARYFRFPFLHAPKQNAAQEALNGLFIELGLISVGETQDSKDVHNKSSTEAYKSMEAAQGGRRYSPKQGIYGRADQPIALFHTKTWRDIKSGVIKAIKSQKSKEGSHLLYQDKLRELALKKEKDRLLQAKEAESAPAPAPIVEESALEAPATPAAVAEDEKPAGESN